MAFDRLRSPQANSIVVGSVGYGPSAYADTWESLVEPYTFVGDGTAGTVNGQTYRCHLFEYSASVTHSITFNRAGVIDVLVCAGGGGGGGAATRDYTNDERSRSGGGGGAGGLILQYNYGVSASQYNITVGNAGGGGGWNSNGTSGQNSVFGSLTAIGGGHGSGWSGSPGSGGSGGGAHGGWYQWGTNNSTTPTKASGTPGQGHPGGQAGGGYSWPASGGGGYMQEGFPAYYSTTNRGGNGGDGITLSFDGTPRTFSAGGGGGGSNSSGGGYGGSNNTGGAGGNSANNGSPAAGYGCGGGGASVPGDWYTRSGGAGSAGIVIVRYAIG